MASRSNTLLPTCPVLSDIRVPSVCGGELDAAANHLARSERHPGALDIEVAWTAEAVNVIDAIQVDPGRAAPLAFTLAGAGILLVSYSFIRLSRHVSDAGSVYALVRTTLGSGTGVVAGWALLGCYVCFTTASVDEAGSFGQQFLSDIGIGQVDWVFITVPLAAVVWLIVRGTVKLATQLLLSVEALSVGLIVILMIVIAARLAGHDAPAHQTLTLDVFLLPHGTGTGPLALAAVFGFLSFAGFEASASLGEETLNPKRAIPKAILLAVGFAFVFFLVCVYIQTVGFGTDAAGVQAFAGSAGPLADLGRMYVGSGMGALIDLGAMISVLGAAIAASSGAARMLYALSRDGFLAGRLSVVDPRSGTPKRSTAYVLVVVLVAAVVLRLFGVNATDAFFFPGSLGTLGLLVAYGLTSLGALWYLSSRHLVRAWEGIFPVGAIGVVGYTFYKQIWPQPASPYAVFPYIVVAWLMLGIGIVAWARLRSTTHRLRAGAPSPDHDVAAGLAGPVADEEAVSGRVPRALVLQHAATEPPGLYVDALLRAGWEVDCRMHRPGLPLLDDDNLAQVDAMVVMGGPMSAAQPSAWREREIALVRAALRRRMPCLGVCLGSQVLAAALGAPVRKGPGPEIGVLPLTLSQEGARDPVSKALGGAPLVFQWHSDTYDLPDGAVRLASSDAYSNQFFRSGNAWGLQFHLETTSELAREWLAHQSYRDSAARVLGEHGIEPFLEHVAGAEPALHAMGRRVATAWVAQAEQSLTAEASS